MPPSPSFSRRRYSRKSPSAAGVPAAERQAQVEDFAHYLAATAKEVMRIRTIELAAQSARMKESARFTRETRNKLTELNK